MSNGWTSPGGDSSGGGDRGSQQPGPYGEQPPPPPYGQHGPSPQYGQQTPQYPPPQYGQYGPPQYGPGGYAPPPFQLAPKPGVIPLRPLNLGDIFNGTFATIRGNPGATLGLSAVVALLVAIPAVLTTLALSNADLTTTDSSGTTINLGSQYSTNVSAIYTLIAGVVLGGMLTAVVAEAVLGRRISIGDTWRKVRRRILPLLGMTLLLLIAAALIVGVVVGIIVVLAVATVAVLAIIAGILLGLAGIVGLVFLAVKVSLAAPAVVLERIGPIAALRRSWSLTTRQWWRVFGISLLAQLIVAVISNIVQVPGAILLLSSMNDAGEPQLWALLVVQLVAVAVSALTAPFTAGVTALLYLDQRIRKEALDVTLMAAAGKDGLGGG